VEVHVRHCKCGDGQFDSCVIVYVKWWFGQIAVAQFDNHTLGSTLIAGGEEML